MGRTLGELAYPEGVPFSVMHVRRGDTGLLGRADLVLEFGDRLGILARRTSFQAVRKFLGDSIKGTAEFGYISIGLGMALGLLIGAVHVPVPGIVAVAIGLAGVLVVALTLGKLRRTGAMSWTIPISASLVLRNLGLTLFLAQVGLSSGRKFAATVARTGFAFLGMGAMILAALVSVARVLDTTETVMNSPDRDIGVIAVLLQRLENDRLPTMFGLKKKVDAGERLSDGDIEYLNRVLAEAKDARLQPLLDRHPEYRELAARTFALYGQIIDRALENENRQKE